MDRKNRLCANCAKAYLLEWRSENKDKVSEYESRRREAKLAGNKVYYREHRELLATKAKDYRSKHPEAVAATQKASRAKHRESVKARGKVYYREHREAQLAKRKAYYREHRETCLEASKRWSQENPARVAVIRQKAKQGRRARMRGAEVSDVDIKAVWEASGGICFYCNALVPDLPGYRHTDHLWPLALKGAHAQDNLRAACYRCNTSKGAKPPDEWKATPVLPKKSKKSQPHLFNPEWR